MNSDNKSNISKPKRICCRAGNVFCVEVEGLHKRYFQYLGKDLKYLGGDIVRVFKKRYPMSYEPVIEDIISDIVDFYRYSWVSLGVKQGYWYRVGTSKNLGDLSNIYFIYDSSISSISFISTSSNYAEHWGIIRAFTGIHHKIGVLPVKYQIYEKEGITHPQYLYKHICSGYNYCLGPRFIKRNKLSETNVGVPQPGSLKNLLKSIISKQQAKSISKTMNDLARDNDYKWCCEVTTRLEETTMNGLPTGDEQRVLDKFEEILDYIVKGPDLDNPEGIYAGPRISEGKMISVWMVRNYKKAEAGLNRYLEGSWCLRYFEFRFERDEAWANVSRFINGTSE